jgi:hypothetical protein
MAISKIVKSFNAKRANNTYVFLNTANGRGDLTAEANTDSEADALILAQIQAKVATAQSNTDELNEVLVLAGS